MSEKVDEEEFTQKSMMDLLEWSFEKATDGLPGTLDAYELAEDYLKRNGTIEDSVDSLIRMQNTKAGISGFVSGLGGLSTLPGGIPANLASVVYVQMRMVSAIAIMGGFDLKDDQVKTMVFASLVGNGAIDILKQSGLEIGKKAAISALINIPSVTITRINEKVGFSLLTKFGDDGTVSLAKTVPVLSGIVSATIDIASTMAVGKAARRVFIYE